MAAQALTAALSAQWDRRLENWALWRAGGSRDRVSIISSAYARLGARDPWRRWDERGTALPPPLVGEALDTDTLVLRLEDVLRRAVEAWYLWSGNLTDRARDLGCARDTLRNRVCAAKLELEAMKQRQRGAAALRAKSAQKARESA